MLRQKDIELTSHGLRLQARLFFSDENDKRPGLLFLAGARSTSFQLSERYNAWREDLSSKGINSIIFDGPGIGDSEGTVGASSLVSRLHESIDALRLLVGETNTDPDRLGVVALSMGAHIAVRMTETEKGIRALVLDRPAAYGQAAEDKPFDSGFTEAIRPFMSWDDSRAFTDLAAFKGRTMVIYGSKEEVVPEDIQNRYRSAAKNNGFNLTLPCMGHFYVREKSESGLAAEREYMSKATDFLLASLS